MTALDRVLQNLDLDEEVLEANVYLEAIKKLGNYRLRVFDRDGRIVREDYYWQRKKIDKVFWRSVWQQCDMLEERENAQGTSLTLDTNNFWSSFTERHPGLRSVLFNPSPEFRLTDNDRVEAYQRLVTEYPHLVTRLFKLSDNEMKDWGEKIDVFRLPGLSPEQRMKLYQERSIEYRQWMQENYDPFLYKAYFILTRKYEVNPQRLKF